MAEPEGKKNQVNELQFEELKKSLQKRCDDGEFIGKKVMASPKPLDFLSKLRIGTKKYTVVGKPFLVVINEAPGAFWQHPVIYELHDTVSGDVRKIYEKSRISYPKWRDLNFERIYPPYSLVEDDQKAVKPKKMEEKDIPPTGLLQVYMPVPDTRHKRAILFGGPNGNFQYDIINMRDVLLERYAFRRNRISIMLDDGKPFIDEEMEISIRTDFPASRENLDDLLVSLGVGGGQEMKEDDTLLIYIFSHGGKCEDTNYFATYGVDSDGCQKEEYYHDFELAGRLSYINCGQLIVIICACESGGFAHTIINRLAQADYGPKKAAVMAATRNNQLGWTLRLGKKYFSQSRHNVFSAFFYAALNAGYPAAILSELPGYAEKFSIFIDADGDGQISIKDAWNWTNHKMRNHHIVTLLGMEIPVYGEYPIGAGDTIFLGKPELMVREYSPGRRACEIFFLDPAALSGDKTILDDQSTAPGSKHFWGNTYRAGEENLLVAIVYNTGCAPCWDITVEFRTEDTLASFLIGTSRIEKIDTGEYVYAYVRWRGPSLLSIIKIKQIVVRVSGKADPAPPYQGKETRECRHIAKLKQVNAKTKSLKRPFDEIKEFDTVYPTFWHLITGGYGLQQALRYSKIYKLVFDRPEFEGFTMGGLQGDVKLEGETPWQVSGGWVEVALQADEQSDYRANQAVKQKIPLTPEGSYLFQLLPAGTYHIHVECMLGAMDDTIEVKKFEVSQKDFIFEKNAGPKK